MKPPGAVEVGRRVFMLPPTARDRLRLVIRNAFSELELHRRAANIRAANRASLRLVRHVGFRREGFSPRYLKALGGWRGHERWTLTVEDFRR